MCDRDTSAQSDRLPIEPVVQNKQDCPEDSGHWELFKEAICLAILAMRSPVPDCQVAYAGH